MSLFFRLFETGIPWTAAVGTILTAVVVTCLMIWQLKQNIRQRVLMVWIVACLFLMLYSTVLGRETRECGSIQLVPFECVNRIHGSNYQNPHA